MAPNEPDGPSQADHSWCRHPDRPGPVLGRGAEQALVLVRTADLRYFGQAFEVRVQVPDGTAPGCLCGSPMPRIAAGQTIDSSLFYR